MTVSPISAPELELDGIAHGFFTREGGYSTGIFASLNCGLGSGDDLALVKQNRALVASSLGVAVDHLISGYQEHGTHVAVVTEPMADRPKADGLVSKTPGVALGVLTADCGPILFADPEAQVIGACHAGWKGALAGVYASTVAAMEGLGAKRSRIVAVLGPTISQAAYEVGPEFPKPFLAKNEQHLKFFIPSVKQGHYMFDLPTFLLEKLAGLGLANVVGLDLCTYADEKRFFSYRRSTHRGEADYGRMISAIALLPKMKQGLLLALIFLAGCSAGIGPLEKSGPQPVSQQSLINPPWQTLVRAGPGAGKDVDLETLNGPNPATTSMAAQPIPLTPPPKPVDPNATVIKAVAVAGVTGATAQGNSELSAAMGKVLKAAGWPVASVGKNTLVITALVKLDPPAGPTQTVHISWTVTSPKGRVLGTVAQSNPLPAHSLDGDWGTNADAAAQAAGEGIFKLIEQYR